MRVVSLLPSITELVFELGKGSEVVGVSHECDTPAEAARLPRLTRSRIDPEASSAAIDAAVSDRGGPLFEVDRERLADLRPDLILTQGQCDVCAVDERIVRDIAEGLPGPPRVVSINPIDLSGVFETFRLVGREVGAIGEAQRLIDRFESARRLIAERIDGRPRPRAILLEWTDPPFTSGHWNPEIIADAGGLEILTEAGSPSKRTTWNAVIEARPEVLLIAPCGFTIDRAASDVAAIVDGPLGPRLASIGINMVTVIDGNAYFARPGPRLDESLRIAAAAIHPEPCGDLAPPNGWRHVPVGP